MARAKYQVLVIPYQIVDHDIVYCVFKRKDMDDCWQFIAGGGEEEDQTPLVSAKRESWEEAGIPFDLHVAELETKCSISTDCFKKARLVWGETCLVIPEHCFQRLRYDSNKVALWELDNKIKLGILR